MCVFVFTRWVADAAAAAADKAKRIECLSVQYGSLPRHLFLYRFQFNTQDCRSPPKDNPRQSAGSVVLHNVYIIRIFFFLQVSVRNMDLPLELFC